MMNSQTGDHAVFMECFCRHDSAVAGSESWHVSDLAAAVVKGDLVDEPAVPVRRLCIELRSTIMR